MADKVLGSASVEVFADLTNLRTGLNEARRQTTRAASDMSQAATGARRSFERAGDGLGRAIGSARRETAELNKELRQTGTGLSAIFAGAGVGAAVTGVIRFADEFTNLRSRIALAAGAGENADAIFERLFASAQRNGASVSALASLYVNLRQSIAGLTDVEAQEIGTVLSQTLAISGANAQEAASFIRQIGQALASGVLRGDEFNSVMENNARFARLLAAELGVGVGELRAMAEQGKLTATAIRSAISSGSGGIQAEFDTLPLTISRSFQQVENALLRYVGQADQGLGASVRLAQGIEALAENFDELADALIVLGGAGIANLLGRGLNAGLAGAGSLVAAQIAQTRAAVAAAKAELPRAESRASAARQAAKAASDAVSVAEREIANAQREIALRQGMIAANERRARTPPGTPGLRAQRAEQDPLGERKEDPDIRNRRELEIAERRLALASRAREQAQRDLNIANSAATSRERALLVARSNLSRASSLAATSLRGLALAGGLATRSFGGLVGVLGGPLPALLTAVALVLLFYKTSADKARIANNSLADALSILASSSEPAKAATQGVADASGDLADKTGIAAEAADELAKAHNRASAAAKTRTDAERALAEVQRLQAIATIQAAIADQRSKLSGALFQSGPEPLREAARKRLERFEGQPGAAAEAERARLRRVIAATTSELTDTKKTIDLLERGLSALTSGALVLGGAGAEASTATASLSLTVETAAERTKRLKTEARGAAEAVKTLQDYIDEGNQSIMQGESELAEKAEDRQRTRAERAAQIVEDATDELTKLRERAAEIDTLFDAGLFKGSEITAGRAMVDVLEDIARAAGDSSEALALLATTRGLGDEDIADATERITGAAREGAQAKREKEDERKLFTRSDVSAVVKDGLLDAMRDGQWKDAFRQSIADALGRALERSLDGVIESIFDALEYNGSGGGGGGILSSIGGALSSIFKPEKRAAGGPVTAGTLYEVNEHGKELFLPNVNGSILSAGATKAATSSKGGSSSTIIQNITLDMRGANIEDAAEAQARLQEAAQRGAIMGAEMVQRQLKANSTL